MSLLEMSFYGGVMILAVTVLRALTINLLPKKTFLVLWGIAVVRLLLPLSLPSGFSVYALFARRTSVVNAVKYPQGMGVLPIGATGQMTVMPGNLSHTVPPSTFSVWSVIWAVGALVCAGVFAVAYWKCRREFQASLPVENDFTRNWLSTYGLKRPISIRQSGRFSTPLTYGVFRPVILMPKTTQWENTTSLQYVLAHEYVHIRRFDSVTKLVLILTLCVHWFNPLVWVMYILTNRDLELSCDEAVVRGFGEHTKAAYARTLISMEETRSGITPMCNNFSKNAIEERITAIMKIKKTSLLALVLACLAVVGTGAAFATSPKEEKETLPSEEQNQILNLRGYMEGDFTLTSYVDPQDGKTYYSWDQGKTFAPLTEEELAQRFQLPQVEWWTYEEYAAWLENEKAELQDMLGEKGWTGGRGEFVWTQEVIDETIAMYENILQEIKEGHLYSKSVNGDDTIMLSQGSADMMIGTTENGK